MRTCFLIFFAMFFAQMAWAQPANDDCSNAEQLVLNAPSPCPNTSPGFNTFQGTNIDATPASPYPTFACTGGNSATLANDVWYSFTSTSNILEITVSNGLSTPNIILFSGSDCQFLNAIDCAVAAPNSGTVTLNTTAVGDGQDYFIMISGGDVTDVGNFDISFTSSFNCDPCLFRNSFTVTPPPVNGTFSSGQAITFCYTVEQWLANAGGTIEWIHALEVDFGAGWDIGSLTTMPPPSCDNQGQWDWYPNPWISCTNGGSYGPGFAYDSASGIGCGGSPGDGDPGNNYGDGGGTCANVGIDSPAKTFCWTISVPDCPPGTNGADLSVSATIRSDGESGSWTQVGCNSGTAYNFIASSVCCTDGNPTLITVIDESCPGANNGSVTVMGNGDPGTTWVYTLFDQSGQQVVGQSPITSDGQVTFSGLEPGNNYSILVQNIAAGCNRNVNFNIQPGVPPTATASVDEPCPGDPFHLMGSTSDAGVTTYQWSGPGGFSSTLQNPTANDAGTYTLVVSVDGCASDPVTTNASFANINVQIDPVDTGVCYGDQITLTGLGGNTYEWTDADTGALLGTGSSLTMPITKSPTNILLTGYDVNLCSDTDNIAITINQAPNLGVDIPNVKCAGQSFFVSAYGADTYLWGDDPTEGAIREFTLTAGNYQYELQGSDLVTGCDTIINVEFTVTPTPTITILPEDPDLCNGSSVTLTAAGANVFDWVNGPNNSATYTVSPTTTTTYTVMGTDFDGCEGTASVTVYVIDPISAPQVTCGNSTPNSVVFNWPPVNGATNYSVVVSTGQTGVLDVTGNPITYTVTGLSQGEDVTITVSTIGGGMCGEANSGAITCTSQNCPPITVNVTSPVAIVCLDGNESNVDLVATISNGGATGTTVWSGTGITDAAAGIFNPTTAGVGAHLITATYTEGDCVYTGTTTINVANRPTATFTINPSPICQSDTATITYTGSATAAATYAWSFDGGVAVPASGQGPFMVHWASPGTKNISLTVTENGCSATFSLPVTVEAPFSIPQVICGNATTSSVVFSWPPVVGATNYTVSVSTGQSGVLDSSGDPVTYTVNGLNPGEDVTIVVTTTGAGVCGNTSSAPITCPALDCPSITVDVVSPVTGVCLDGNETNVDLSATISNGGSGTVVWSGTGIIDAAQGIFDPTNAGVGQHLISATYSEGNCSYTGTITINVTNAPSATFTIDDDAICLSETATITYTGSAMAAATYDWDFGVDGAIVSGSGQGPYMINWTTAGTKTISLTVTENGCTASFSATITLDEPLSPPIVNCGIPTTTSVSFNWLDVAGAGSYTVNVLSGQTGTMNGNVFTVENLQPEEEVMVEVIANSSNNCPNASTMLTCTAATCPVFGLTLSSTDNNICLESDTGVVDLTVAVTGGSGNGTFEWTGTGIVDAQNGTFNPVIAGAGDHVITLTYTDGPCVQSNTMILTVYDKPLADFNLAPASVCINEPVTANYTGGASLTDATFTWTFGGGMATPGTGGGPQEISWATAGEQTVTLVVEENGCVSLPVSQTVMVEAPLALPVINCNSSVDEIIFTWEVVDGATGYDVTVLTGQTGVQGNLSFTVSNLTLLEEVEISVIALGDGACGDSEASSLLCVAEDCPDVMIEITNPMPFCLDGNTQPLALDATITGGAGNGVLFWTGDGVDEVNATFDPVVAGAGTHILNLKYTEGNCNYNASMVIDVFALPTADFSMPDSVCVDGIASVVFAGNAGAGASFNWDFDGGVIVSGVDEGPYEISWASSGMKTVSLVVTENGCNSEPFTRDILVEDPIAAPIITCETTENSITFSWDDVPGAYDYNVIGPPGDLSGNFYAVTGLAPGTSISITVEALTNNSCGLVAASQECFASDCPEMSVNLTGPTALCQGESASIIMNFTDVSTGPFQVEYSLNGENGTVLLSSGEPVVFDNLMTDVDFVVLSFNDLSNPLCTYTATANWQIAVNEEMTSGIALDPLNYCQGEGELVNLIELLNGNDLGGIWAEVSGQSASGFNAANGTLSTENLAAGSYSFIYQIDNAAPCPDQETMVTVMVDPLPNVDAGEDQSLFCNIGMITLGSSNTDAGTYQWTVDNPEVVISDPTALLIDASLAGTYTLEVTNEFGCKSEDMVTVTVQDDVPVADVSVTDVSCFGDNNGVIILNNVTGGTPPYQYSLNGETAVNTGVFSNLAPGDYIVKIEDANGCFSELEFNVTESEELTVRLLPQITGSEPYVIESGDSIRLDVIVPATTVIDTIIWGPKELAPKDNNAMVNVVSPEETTTFSVAVIDINGCSNSDQITIFVKKNRDVYIPNAFSPNGDGVNDVLYIQSGTNVAKIKNFSIYNRWGESVFSRSDFPTNDRTFGWDGKHRGKLMNNAVFVYEVEVEFQDGKVEIISGETILVR